MIILIIVLAVIIIVVVILSRKKHIAEIHTTYDGFFDEKYKSKKKRLFLIDDVRNDGAVSGRKIHSKKDKNTNMIISNLELNPKDHPSLTETSVVEKRVIYGIKQKNNKRRPIYLSDLDKKDNGDKIPSTNDKLTRNEMRKVKEFKNRDYIGKKTTKKWKKHFK